ncbi:Serine/threonine-protein kinase 17A [Halotydeus destructor]|nr:Serine/threonine-protein kinase 17A [Halotydeus destructor]KAI1286058.1 Serine/threonine-protein kinase 17A [Halotydeus destructor]
MAPELRPVDVATNLSIVKTSVNNNLKHGHQNENGFLTEATFPTILCKPLSVLDETGLTSSYDIELKPFARGKFAQVKRCKQRNSNQEYAAKCIRRRRRTNDVTHEILHEIRVLLLAAKCQRIIQLHEVYETPTEFILILEMAGGGELQRILDEEDFLPETSSASISKQLIEAVAFLHDHNIAHLDIKPQNILMCRPYPDFCDIKLCDFGISRVITKGTDLREIVGTPDYVAPEILHYEPISLKTDMWSIGVVVYVLLTGYSPFGADNKQETFCNITNMKLEFPATLFSHISEEAVDFMKKLLVKEPKKRLNCEEALRHEWLVTI